MIVYSGTRLDKGLEHAINRDLIGSGQAATFIPQSLDPAGLIAEVRKDIALPVQG